jgi:hypothetical protein
MMASKIDHRRLWRIIKNDSGIVIKDAAGATVWQIAGPGRADAQARRSGPDHFSGQWTRLGHDSAQADVEATVSHHIRA